MGQLPPIPKPEALGRNGSYVVFRKLQTRVAEYRQDIRARAKNREEEVLLAAKFVGRWASGARLVLAPERDDPQLGADPARNNAFLYAADGDARGLKCPLGAHARRAYARDAEIAGVARNHRILRRSSSYGPMLPKGVLEDDGADRGTLFFCLQAQLARQFEFVKTQWINEGTFFGTPAEIDPLVGPNDGTGPFTIPQETIRRRVTELPQFVVNRGGEYCFMPGLRALRWLADLDT
jgi:Dyp-type peroxidase family